MPKRTTPITVFCRTHQIAADASVADEDSRFIWSGPGTLNFHALIAQHGAGEFTTLYVPLALKGTFAPPTGGIVREI